jgi:hypothetical protein
MCSAPDIKAPPPAPAPPPVLEQAAPRSAGGPDSQARKRSGLSRYRIDTSSAPQGKTNKLGGIPKKTGV